MIPIETRNGFPFPIQSALYCRWPRKHEIDIDERFRNRRIHFSGANTTLQAARLERLPSGSVQEENRSGGVSEENSRARTVRRRKRERALLVVATLSLSLLLIFQRHIPISCAQFGSRWVCIRTAPHTHTHLFLARHFHSNQRHTHSVPCSEWRTFHPSARLSLSLFS